jgi:hypothetical protein
MSYPINKEVSERNNPDNSEPTKSQSDTLKYIADSCLACGNVYLIGVPNVSPLMPIRVHNVRGLFCLVETNFEINMACIITFCNNILNMTFSKAYGNIQNVKVAGGPEVSYDDIKAYLMKIN